MAAQGARTSEPSVSGRSVLPQQKLSRIAIRAGSAPTATQFRSDSSIAAAAIQYGQSRRSGFMPLEITTRAHRAQIDRPHNRSIGRTIVGHSDQRLHDAACLHLVVVLADDPLFGADIEGAEDRLHAPLKSSGERGA